MKPFLIVIIACCFTFHAKAQIENFTGAVSSVETVVDAYNKQDYHLMQKPWVWVGKVIITDKMLRKEFEPFYKRFGSASIDTLVFGSIYNGTAHLKFKSHPEKTTYLNFNFSEKGKIEGMGFGYPTFVFKKNNTQQVDLDASMLAPKIDSIVAKYLQKAGNNFNGCLMLNSDTQVVYKKCIGYANYDTKQALNDSTLFLLASCSKQFTAIAIMQLQEQGKLNYKDNVKKYIPDFPYDSISIDNLLTHTSGLPDYFLLLQKHWDKSKFATNNDVLSLLIKHKPALLFKPNEHFSYSNTGYVILSILIEKISGLSYQNYLSKHIFLPIGLNQTTVYNRRISGNHLPNYALGYVYSQAQKRFVLPDSLANYKYVTYMDGITGDDGVSSNLNDLKIWNEALRNNLLVNKASLDLAYTNHILNNGKAADYGYGVFLKQGTAVENLVYHTGGWPGYATMILRFKDRNINLILLSNNNFDDFTFLIDEVCSLILQNNTVSN
jgi:CubicO group peptidase (beta-lactamase class C family)